MNVTTLLHVRSGVETCLEAIVHNEERFGFESECVVQKIANVVGQSKEGKPSSQGQPFRTCKSILFLTCLWRRNPKYKGMGDAFKKVWATEGLKGLYRGFGPAMARSIPANAVCFLAYEVVRDALG